MGQSYVSVWVFSHALFVYSHSPVLREFKKKKKKAKFHSTRSKELSILQALGH